MAKFTKKPIEVEAVQFKQSNGDVYEWAVVHGLPLGGRKDIRNKGYSIFINTLEGEMEAHEGDWIIKGIHGEFYPCKPDIFEKTYSPVNE